jgi:hypothetical protein
VITSYGGLNRSSRYRDLELQRLNLEFKGCGSGVSGAKTSLLRPICAVAWHRARRYKAAAQTQAEKSGSRVTTGTAALSMDAARPRRSNQTPCAPNRGREVYRPALPTFDAGRQIGEACRRHFQNEATRFR